MKANAGSLKRGDFIEHQGEIWQVQKTEFSFQGRGMAVMRTKLKSLTSGKNVDVTYKTVAQVEKTDITVSEMQYLYSDGPSLYFMDSSFEQYAVPQRIVGDISKFLKEGEKYYVLLHNGLALNIRPPATVKLTVIETNDAVKGDTVSGAKKNAIVETGTSIIVPLFIKKGDVIVINPETGEYVERTKN